MTVTLNIVMTALIAGLAAGGGAVMPVSPQVGGAMLGASAILKIVDGYLTHQAVKP